MSPDQFPTKGFRTLFEAAPDPYLVLSSDLTILAASDAYLRATRTKRQEIIGRHVFEAFPDNPDDPSASGVGNLRASLNRVLQTRTPDAMAVQKYDIRLPDAEGGGFEERFWSPLNTPVVDEQGDLEFIIHRVEDVTDFIRLKQKGAEQQKQTEELKTRAEQMERDIFHRAQQLQEANERLREAERLKSEFFANVSHELRTPLSLILAPAESLLAGKHGEISSEQAGILHTIHNNAIRLLQMVTGLLDFAKTEAGKMTFHPEPTDVRALTLSVAHDFLPLTRERKITLTLQGMETPLWLMVDRYLFERLLFNLLSNAVKFTPAGGEITVQLKWVGETLRLAVIDTGIGIAEEDISILFQKFRQVEGSSTRRFEGTGLGLAMVKEFAELMGGVVEVKSQLGKGSAFTIVCPTRAVVGAREKQIHNMAKRKVRTPFLAGRGGDRQRVENEEQKEITGFRMKVLVCEDNAELAEYIATLLHDLCEVRLAADGREGLRLVCSWSPDLVLSDVMMPGLDGNGLCSAIKSDPLTANTVVVLLTAQTNREAMLRGWEAKADEYLFKPFHPDELLTRIRSLLSIVAERREHNEMLMRKNRELAIAQTEMEQKSKLEQYARSLERSNKELAEFASLCAHDMKSPLASLRGLVALMEQKEGVKEEQKNVFEMMKKTVWQMQRTIHSLNDAVEYKRKLTAPREPVRFDNVLGEAEQSMSESIQSSGASIRSNFSACPVTAFPRLHLKSILQHLLSNAIKYAKDGQPPVIDIRTLREGQCVILEFKDGGIGIDLDLYRDKIFGLFQRFHTHREGMGVGLYMIRSIVDAYEGNILVDSTVGKGTLFKISLANAYVQEDLAC